MKPISPDEVKKIVPDFVIEAANLLIQKNWTGSTSTFTKKDLIVEIQRLAPDLSEAEIYKQLMLDIEPIYRDIGWEVTYDSPGYQQSYDAFFRFKKKKG
jgi:hypothetical protein